MCKKLPLKIAVQAVTEKCSIYLDFKVNLLGILFKNFKIYDFIEIFDNSSSCCQGNGM